jgi:pilus assembly protein CpaF
MRFPGDPDDGALRGRAVRSPAEATMIESDARAASSGMVFPPHRADSRARQLEEAWLPLFRELRGSVDSTLSAGLSAGDVAYRLGELVHSYFRTRGVTLTSFELRRIVVELLDNHKRGWPTLKPTAGPGAPPSSLVDFVDGDPDARAIRDAAGLPTQAAPPAAPMVIEAMPSPLVSLEPRSTSISSLSVETAGPGVVVTRPTRDLSSPKERPDTLTQEQIARMEAAAADAADVVFGGEAPADAPSAEISVEAALAAAGARVGDAEPAPAERVAVDNGGGLGALEPLLRDPSVTAIMVNAADAMFVERRGQIERVGGFRDPAHLAAALDRLARFAGKPATGAARPVVEGRLPDGGRFVIVSPPLAPSGPLCTITRPPAPTATLDDLVGRETLSRPMATLLRAAARGRLNILVSGRAESGRTTMLSALTRTVAPSERVVTVERRPELRLDLGNVVSLVAPEAGPEMVAAIDLSLAIAAASRLRPDRLVIDGLGNGAVAALASLIDGGRDGVVASCEAGSPGAALEELARHIAETEPGQSLAAARKRVAGAFDLVVHLEAFRHGVRRVTHIAEVAGADGESVAGLDLYTYDPAPGRPNGGFVDAGRRPLFLPRLAKLGLDQGLFDPA